MLQLFWQTGICPTQILLTKREEEGKRKEIQKKEGEERMICVLPFVAATPHFDWFVASDKAKKKEI